MSADELVQRNVVVLPTGEVLSRALRWSGELASLNTEFVLNSERHPHLSVYQAAYPRHNAERVAAATERVAETTKPFEVVMRSFSIFWGTFIFWDAVKSADLTSVHQRLLTELNPLREGRLLPINQQVLADEIVPRALRDSIRRYGHPMCGEQECPHITLTRLRDAVGVPQALAVLSPASGTPMSFLVSVLCLTEVGPHGTCPRILCAFPLMG